MGILLLVTIALGQDVPDFDADRSFRYLEKQCSFGPRNPGSVGHRECLIYLKETLSGLADTLMVQPFAYSDPYSGKMLQLTNLVARFQPQRKNRIWTSLRRCRDWGLSSAAPAMAAKLRCQA